ncbi:MAG: D-alanyl-D-alanine carboxypeptidase, partial [Clostridia bacterium]|nr:D-alanyl-D-alanine carboxypeptidase [Clostridia bacterium]
ASVTKVMTILLTLEAIDEGNLREGDKVLVSPHAAGMGGSQAFLDANQTYAVSELLKSVIIASANDAAVALAEHIAGTEEAFVQRMNERAQAMGLENTRYVNCTGLPAQGHYASARDIAALSAELDRHPLYYTFSTVWMDEIRHSGGRVTQLTNTNRLVRFYPGCDGYKTGSTNEARYCISATAKKNGMRLIAVVLGAQAGQTRFDEARAMLEYGFAGYQLFSPVSMGDSLGMDVSVRLGAQRSVPAVCGDGVSLLLPKGAEKEITLEAALVESAAAPVRAGDLLGEIRVLRRGTPVATVPAVAGKSVELPGMVGALLRIRDRFMLGGGKN